MLEKPQALPRAARPPVAIVLQQHADELAHLRVVRGVLTRAPHVRMLNVRRLDDRIAAHVDGLSVAGSRGRELCMAALVSPGVGELFAATVSALTANDETAVHKLLALGESLPEAQSGLTSAFGWMAASSLRGVTKAQLDSSIAFRRLVGLAACGMHGVDPGLASARWVQDQSPPVRARALRTIGEVGVLDAQPHVTAALSDPAPTCQFWGAWSAVLLGNRGVALDTLADAGLSPGPHRARAFRLMLQAMDPAGAHALLQELAAAPEDLRCLIEGSGIVGDLAYLPWLISHMAKDVTARLAGEAFSLITGVDLATLDLDRPVPGSESGPNDDPSDPNVEMDPDESLPWPDPDRIKAWWAKNGGRFQSGTRYFMGQPVTREHCIEVLKNGYQRQRILAAHYLCLLDPGTPLFNTSAPAWRQQKLLASMK